MRAQLERVVPGAEALVGTAESIPLDDDSVDAVFVAEAFHWFGTSAALDRSRASCVQAARSLSSSTSVTASSTRHSRRRSATRWTSSRSRSRLRSRSRAVCGAPFPGPFEPLKEERFRTRSSATARACSHPSPGAWSPACPMTSAPCSSAAELISEGRYVSSLRTELYRTRLRPRSLGNPAEVRIGQRVHGRLFRYRPRRRPRSPSPPGA